MPKYYCDYCDTYLTHDSPSVRKTHCNGRRHKDNVKFYYQLWMENQAQNLIDATTAAFIAGKIPSAQYSNAAKPAGGVMIPPPPNLQGLPRPVAPGQAMPVMGPPMMTPIACPMPVMGPPGPIPPNMMMPGMRAPVTMMPITPIANPVRTPII
ncbi:u1 small nuclear ribonucleoprotein C [Nephila pilipes]|uniref:U1 small nuclear ribonucleoprotein C n=1 Tax=Nephila pilipes TaxID=299642 RepID=A0A8X6P520_NEPPI|nr:u1 small nuclear ribonucleoprotein C [Nephila pilipes]